MTDIFFDICKHVLERPTMNTDLTKFVPDFDLYEMDDDKWIMYTRFLRPFMYKVHECHHCTTPFTKNLFAYRNLNLKFEWYMNMHTIRPTFFSEGKDDLSLKGHLNRRYPAIAPQGAIDLFVMCQRHYHSLLKFVNIVKMRYTKAKNRMKLHPNEFVELILKDRGPWPLLTGVPPF